MARFVVSDMEVTSNKKVVKGFFFLPYHLKIGTAKFNGEIGTANNENGTANGESGTVEGRCK